MSSILSFSFPREDAARAIKSLPQQLPTSVKITGTVTSLYQMITLQKSLIKELNPSFFHLDLSDLKGLPFIGFGLLKIQKIQKFMCHLDFVEQSVHP